MDVVSHAPALPRPASRSRLLGSLAGLGMPVLLFVLSAVVGWLRLSPVVRQTVWAEDGRVFLLDEVDRGPVDTVFQHYAGYLHVVPRILVAIARVLPMSDFAVATTLLSVLTVAGIGVLVYVLTDGVLRSRWVRVVLALVPTLVPLGPVEIAGNVANLHWFLLFLAPFVFLAPVRTWLRGSLLGLVALLIGLTEIQLVAFLPLLALGIRNPRRLPVLIGALLGTGAQVFITLSFPRTVTTPWRNTVSDVVIGFIAEPFAGAATWNTSAVGRLIAAHGLFPLVVPLVVVVVALVAGVVVGRASQRWTIAATAFGAVAVWSGAVLLNPSPQLSFTGFDADHWRNVWSFRYTAASSMFVLAAVLSTADAFATQSRRWLRAVGIGLVGVVLVVFLVALPRPHESRDAGPVWRQEVDRGTQQCSTGRHQTAEVHIAPSDAWSFDLPCDDLR